MSEYRRYWLRKRLWQTVAFFERSTFVRWLFAPVLWLFRVRAAMRRKISFVVRSWFARIVTPRRSVRDFLLGVPAILVFLGFAAATAMGHLQQRDGAQRYLLRGEQELRAGNAHAAKIYLQKAMLSDQTERRDIAFALARAYQATKEFDRSNALMESLASVGKVGYPPAHRYQALRIAHRISQTKQVDDWKGWQWHLTHADQGDSAQMQKCWGMYFLARGDLDRARTHLRRAAEQEPRLLLQVAQLDLRLNDQEAVEKTLKTARQRLEQHFLRDPSSPKNRLLYVTSLLSLGDLAEAERLLTEGLQESDNQAIRQLLAVVCVKRYDVEVRDPERRSDAVKWLGKALNSDPGFRLALTRLISFARSTDEQLQESRETLQQLIASGKASAMAHFTLGILEWTDGNIELAEFNMRQAIALDDRFPVVANNLAYLIAQSENGDLQEALALAEQAVQAEGTNHQYRDTRGFILEKLGRLSEAAVDYQQALETSPDPTALQQKLADLYDRLGDPALAAEYREATEHIPSTPAEHRLRL